MDTNRLLDLAITTLHKEPANEFMNLMAGQSYIFDMFFKGIKPKQMTGLDCHFNAIIKGDSGDTDIDATATGFGVWDGAYDEIPAIGAEYQAQGTIGWTQQIATMVVTEKEIIQNSGKEGYIDLVQSKKEAVATRFANILERQWWSTAGYLHESDDAPWFLGPEYWITDDGYHINDSGGSSGTLVGGIDPTSSTYNDPDTSVNRWRNQFQNITSANQMLDAMDDLHIDCMFKAPPNVSMNSTPAYNKFRIVFNKNGFKTWKRLMRRLKEPLDESQPTFNNTKVEMADKMAARSDGTNQGFYFNLDTWRAWVAQGKNFSKDTPREPERQPGVRYSRIHFWPAIGCIDRRRNGKVFGFPTEPVES